MALSFKYYSSRVKGLIDDCLFDAGGAKREHVAITGKGNQNTEEKKLRKKINKTLANMPAVTVLTCR